jgi:hypothetical protein
MKGDGIRRYPNGANRQPPRNGLLLLDEVLVLSRAEEDLKALSEALPSSYARDDAGIALRAIERLFARDRQADE